MLRGRTGGEPLRYRPIRMTHDRENNAAFEDFLELWRKLLADSLVPGTVVVVEGERDPPVAPSARSRRGDRRRARRPDPLGYRPRLTATSVVSSSSPTGTARAAAWPTV